MSDEIKINRFKFASSEEAIEKAKEAFRYDNLTAWDIWCATSFAINSQLRAKAFGWAIAFEVSPKAELLSDFWDSWQWFKNLPIDDEDYLDVIERSRIVLKEILDTQATKLEDLKSQEMFLAYARRRFKELRESEKYKELWENLDTNGS